MKHLEVFEQALKELQFEVSRSSGSGGQNVNKVSSRVGLRWNLEDSEIPEDIKDRLRKALARLMNIDGDVLLFCQESRDQLRNKELCKEKLAQWIERALKVQKARKATRPTRSSQKRRLDKKRRHKDLKGTRRKPLSWD
jgi:ribosome-associated protein